MKMIFIANNWADAHQQVRLSALLKLNLSITSLAVLRNYYSGTSAHTPIFLGRMKHVSYEKRGCVYIRLLYQLSKHVAGNDFLYVFGFDLMLICLIFKAFSGNKIKVIYEVPDIREMFFSASISGKLIRWIEEIAIPKTDLLIATSPDFISEYFIGFRKILIPDSLIIENKIHLLDIEKTFSVSHTVIRGCDRKIRIGYFGVLRCPASLSFLIKLAQSNRFEIILRGIFMPLTEHYKKVIQDANHIHYLGSYQVPQDLDNIYSSVDVIWAVYPFSENIIGNHQFARTNRFYESLYFEKPFIVQTGTADAGSATLLGNIALVINLNNEARAVEFLTSNLTPDKLAIIKKQLLTVPENIYLITNEYKDLETWLQLNR